MYRLIKLNLALKYFISVIQKDKEIYRNIQTYRIRFNFRIV